jgi:hypothetical protein
MDPEPNNKSKLCVFRRFTKEAVALLFFLIQLGFTFVTVNRFLLSYILFSSDDKLKRCRCVFGCCLYWQARTESSVLPTSFCQRSKRSDCECRIWVKARDISVIFRTSYLLVNVTSSCPCGLLFPAYLLILFKKKEPFLKSKWRVI